MRELKLTQIPPASLLRQIPTRFHLLELFDQAFSAIRDDSDADFQFSAPPLG
jgi:hypothetical protein